MRPCKIASSSVTAPEDRIISHHLERVRECQLLALTVILTACISTQADFSKSFQEIPTDQTDFYIYCSCVLIAVTEEVVLEMPREAIICAVH